MGTIYSHTKRHRNKREATAGYSGDPRANNSPPKGKPSPPQQPHISDITHNSVMLSWQPPRRHTKSTVIAYTIEMTSPSDPKAWTAVTKCCQGNSYQVKNLAPSSRYVFRVRAENIHGLSKGSRPSEVVETKMYSGVEQQVFPPASEERASSVPLHQHSINLHLERSVTSILNHTDIKVRTNSNKEVKVNGEGESSRSFRKSQESVNRSLEVLGNEDEVDGQGPRWRSSSLQRDGYLRSSLQPDRVRPSSFQRDANWRSSLQPDRWRSNSLQREAFQRSSLQPSRKRSLPILLGTRMDSLNKLRDSQTFPVTTKNRLNETSLAVGRKRAQNWRERSTSDADSSVSGSKEDVMNGKTLTENELKPPKRDSGLEEDAENAWEKDDSSSETSDGVLSTTLSEDKKVELSSPFLVDNPSSPWMGVRRQGVITPPMDSGQADFRTLRSLLHSDDIIVKAAHSLPDMATRKISPTYNALTTIVDLEEEDESVRITTL